MLNIFRYITIVVGKPYRILTFLFFYVINMDYDFMNSFKSTCLVPTNQRNKLLCPCSD